MSYDEKKLDEILDKLGKSEEDKKALKAFGRLSRALENHYDAEVEFQKALEEAKKV